VTEALLAVAFTCAAGAALWWLTPLHPAQLWLLPWAAAADLLAIGLIPYAALSLRAAGLMLAGSAAFCIGALLCDAPTIGEHRRRHDDIRVVRLAAGTALVLLGVAMVAFLVQIAVGYGPRAVIVTSPDVRHAIGTGQFAITIKYVYLAFIAATLAGLAGAKATAALERRFWLAMIVVAAGTAYFSTGRSTIVLSAACGALGYLLAREHLPTRKQLLAGIAVGGLVTFAVFSAGGAIIGKTLEGNALSQVRSAFTDHAVLRPFALPYQYATAPLVAFDAQVQVNGIRPKAEGCATLATFCSAGQAVGLPTSPEPDIEPFTAEPLPWNTFTALDRPLMDGGPLLVPFVLLMLGLGTGLLFRLMRRGKPLAQAAYPPMASAILYSSTQMNFFAPHILAGALGSVGLLLAWRFALQRAGHVGPVEPNSGIAGPNGRRPVHLRIRLRGALGRLDRGSA